MSDLLDQLTALEKRLLQARIDLLMAMAQAPAEHPLPAADLSRVSDIHASIEAVRAELAARLPREGYSR